MHPVLAKTLGGLSRAYYFRQFVFGMALFALMLVLGSKFGEDWGAIPLSVLMVFAVYTVLYPYSRFVYDSVVGFVMGNTVIVMPLPVLLLVKFFGMLLCFMLAPIIAPVGLAWLYWHHSRAPRQD